MKYFIKTFGCQMNKSDSERITSVLESLKYKKTNDLTKAQLVILNTCSVRDSAESRVLSLIRNLKKKNKNVVIGVTGCMIHIRPDKLEKNTNFLFDIRNLSNLPKLLENNLCKQVLNLSQLKTKSYFKINPIHQSNFQAYVPIMTGCNNFCTYCVVPYTRDREKSRASKDIIKEVKNLIKQGYQAITLLGQNVNSYGNDLKNEIKFPDLLSKLAKIEGNFWIWFVTSHPKDMSNDLIDIIAKNNKICNYIHLPIQAGSNKILKAMNRGYTKEKYLELVEKIRKKIKDVSLSTDIIIGFPGETKQDFNDTINIFKLAKFDMVYICRYSPRPKTVAFKFKNNVSILEKKRRDKVLTKLLEKYSLEFNKKLIGKTVDVLVENKSKNNIYIGKTKTYKTVKVASKISASKLIGKIVKIKIKKADNSNLEGRIK